jgi:hypothetical protein
MSIKSINLLPEVFRTEPNRKFLAATIDQLISEGDQSVRLDSYVGRTNAPTWKSGDTYVTEPNRDRQNYQLETSVIVDGGQGRTDFYSSYLDLLQQIAYYGGITTDHSRLFANQSYTFDGCFDIDKFVNFNNYLWLPNGPPEITITAGNLDIALEYNVVRNLNARGFQFTEYGDNRNPIITLVKGQSYKFLINQPGNPFWIQTAAGISGTLGPVAEQLNRQILGLSNNGIDSGIIEFNVPLGSAQDTHITAVSAATVDFATTASYREIQSHLVNQIAKQGGIDGVSQGLNGKTIVFVNTDVDNDQWKDPGNFDFDKFDENAFEYGETVAGEQRRWVFRIRTVDVGNNRQVIKLDPLTAVLPGQKVYVKAGQKYSNVELLLNNSGFYEPIDPITAPLDTLYYQDDLDSGFFGIIRLVNPGTETINVDADIVGAENYTSPNQVVLTNGMHIKFDNTATPAKYANNNYIVEGVGTAIKLINIGNFSVPEQYAVDSKLITLDYITINRASKDLNAWSRSNRWFHISTVEDAAKYREDPALLDLSLVQRGKRPIIEFDPNIYLFDYGRTAKSPVDIIDFTITNAFQEVEGQVYYTIRMPNGVTRQLTPGVRIIFAADEDPDVRRRIYRVDFITTSAGNRIHLVSQNTEDLPAYEVSGVTITSNLSYNFVPTVTFANPLPGIGTRVAQGNVILKDSGIESISVDYGGVNYIADPYINISSAYVGEAQTEIIYRTFKQVDYIRINSAGTGYTATSPGVSISNPNQYWATVTNVTLGTSGLTFEVSAGSLINPPTTGVVEVDETGNVVATFSNIGLGYYQANVSASFSTPIAPAGTLPVVNNVYLHANGAIKSIRLSSNGSGYLTEPNITITGANTYTASVTTVGRVTTSATLWDYLTPGYQIIANGIIGGTIISAIDNEANLITINAPAVSANLDAATPLTGVSTVSVGDLWTFKSNATAGTYATATVKQLASKSIKVNDTSMLDVGMVVSGGRNPVLISDIRIDVVPTRIITTSDHGFIDGDLVYIRSIVGTVELNFSRYYVKRISENAIDLYSSSGLTTVSAQDSRNFTNYLSGGQLTAYTIDYGLTKVTKVSSETEFEVNREITILEGTKLVFGGVPALATARSDGNSIYNISITEPGSGYTTAPTVAIDAGAGNHATATAITNDNIINYIKIVDPGTGYTVSSVTTAEIISDVEILTSAASTHGSTTLYFENAVDLIPVQAGWLAFLVSTINGEEVYTDFAQQPYATTDSTGPNTSAFQSFMDVSRTTAIIRSVINVDSDQIILDGPINAQDSDGELTDLPKGSRIVFTAQNRFFTADGAGSGARLNSHTKAGFICINELVDTDIMILDNVTGIQPGMLVGDLAGLLPYGIRVKTVDAYTRRIGLQNPITLPALTQVTFSDFAQVTPAVAPAEISSITITDPGAGYVHAPEVTIQSLIPDVELIGACTGSSQLTTYLDPVTLDPVIYQSGNVISVSSYTGVVVGSKLTSNYNNQGVGITTGADRPTVVALVLEQTASAVFEPRIVIDKKQPAFSDIIIKFTQAAEGIAQVFQYNNAINYLDDTPETYDVDDTVVVNIPANQEQTATNVIAYNQFYFDGTVWTPSQQKESGNQEPLYDAFDTNGYSAADSIVYPGSKFVGTRIFGYKLGTGTSDSILKFPLSYKNFENVGDIEFSNYFQTDSFNFLSGFAEVNTSISNFVLKQQTESSGVQLRNIWTPIGTDSKQFQLITHEFDGTTNYFELDVKEEISREIPYLKVYVNNTLLLKTQYTVEQYGARTAVVIPASSLSVGQQITIKVYSKQQSLLGHYQTPINHDANPLNSNFESLSLGQIRNHLVTKVDNHYGIVGPTLGKNNLRDLYNKNWQGSILQHASPVSLASLFLVDHDLNIIQAVEFAQKEYTKFKNKFIDMTARMQIDPMDIPGSVDLVLKSMMTGKSTMSPWYDSDMVPYGNKFRKVTTLPILNTRQKTYLIPSAFDLSTLSRRSVLVYLKDTATRQYRQLVNGVDFDFSYETSSIVLGASIVLTYTSELHLMEYSTTVENYIPETPTKLGMYPKYIPRIYVDNTYREPTLVVEGHDGSITPAFGDYRDELLLELEVRIYNNIKVRYEDTLLEIYDTIPGKYRKTDYSRQEWNQLLSRSFLGWIGSNRLDYSANDFFNANDPWTWNYAKFIDRTGEKLPGHWRGIYKYYYDTDRPHTHPWEMLGFSERPSYWNDRYGPAPYTSGNRVLWGDIESGYIHSGPRAGIDQRFARPGLLKILPVDDTGVLLDPLRLGLSSVTALETSSPFSIGDIGPVEAAWRRSSDFAYAVQLALILARPAFYLGTQFDNSRYRYDSSLGQITDKDTRQRLIPRLIKVPDSGIKGQDVILTAGYGNWIRDYLAQQGVDGSAKMRDYFLRLDVRLSYKIGGFTDKNMLEVVAEQSSPGGSGRNIIVPDENYRVYLHKSTPTKRLAYSAVIVEVSNNGWKVSGYNTTSPYFTIVPSQVNNNGYALKELKVGVTVYKDYQLRKLIVPYGYEFNTHQQLADFLTSYGRYLKTLGFVFDEFNNDLGVVQDWDLSIREFLTWSQQGWKQGSIIVLSPTGSKISSVSDYGVIDQVTNKNTGNRLLDQNFSLIRQGNYSVSRNGGVFTATAAYGKMIALADLSLVEYEHVLIFDNQTVFSDVINQPEIGNRQYRLRLTGYKSGAWNGQLSAPGFIYNNENVDAWQPGKSYNIGSLVEYKNQYFIALQKVPEETTFDFNYWKPIDKNKIKTGLLVNFSNSANRIRDAYDLDQMKRHENFDNYSNGIIGFRNREFLQDLGIDRSTQVKFYQGYIKQKGTKNAITSLTAGNFDRVTSEITLYEEWALRVGEYGATGSDQYIEVALDEQSFTDDPSTINFLNFGDADAPGAINFTPYTIYRGSEEVYNKNIVKARNDLLPRIGDNVTAGYPRLDDIDGTMYDIASYQNYFGLVGNLGSGYKLWVGVDTDKSWNVYRATETDVLLLSITRTNTSQLLFVFDKPHGTTAQALIVIKNFDDNQFDGFYVVTSVQDNLSVLVTGYRNLDTFAQIQTVESSGVYFRMVNVRFDQVSSIINFTPPHGWRNEDRVWIDNDTANKVWGVYQKTDGWKFNQLLPLRQGEDRYLEAYGKEVRLSVDNQIVLAGTPNYTNGSLSGLKVIDPGANYASPAVRIGSPTGLNGQVASFAVLRDNGALTKANVLISGTGYTIAPNVVISDEWNTVTTAETLNSANIYLSSADMTRIYSGDYVSGIGIPADTQVTAIKLASNLVEVQGPNYSGLVSATNITVATGIITFTTGVTATSTPIVEGDGIRAYVSGDPTTYLEGYVESFVGTALTANIQITAGSGAHSSWLITSSLSVRTGTALRFYRGTAGRAIASLAPSGVDSIQVVDGGSGFVQTPVVQIVGGGGSGAQATAYLLGNFIEKIVVTNQGSGYTEAPSVLLLTSNPTPVNLVARLQLTTVNKIVITDKGQDYRDPTIEIVTHSADTSTSAVGTMAFYGNGGVQSITFASSDDRGYSYGSGTTVTIANSATGSGFVGSVATFANGKVNSVTVTVPGSGYETAFAKANIFYAGGSGATGNIGRTIDGIGTFTGSTVLSYGQGYLVAPTVEIIDQSGSGTGAIVEPIFPTGQVKTFLRPNQGSYTIEETQLIKPFNSDAREFGYSLDIGTILAAIGAPGTYSEQGGVYISQTLGSQWISYQMIFPDTLSDGDRFGHSVAMSDDQQWIYIGAPGANKVYCYGKKTQTFTRVTLTPVTGQIIYGTNLLGLKSANEIKVLGANGKLFEPNFDYTVDNAGGIFFADYDRIGSQPAIYITRQRLQTTIIPTVIRNLTTRSYALESTPETIDQLLVYGATGRVFVPNKEFIIVGSNIVFLDDAFLSEPSIVATQKDLFYQLVDVIEPPDAINSDANFGWSVRCDQGGYRIIVGAPDTDDIDKDGNTIPSAGRTYVFNRSYEIILSLGDKKIFTFDELRNVVAITIDNTLLTNLVDYSVENNSVILTKYPRNGAKIKADTNFFNLVQTISCPTVVNLGRFGASVDIAPDNKSLAIGSPGYRDEGYYNGHVYRYVNKGLFYGSVTTEKTFLETELTLGQTIRINDRLATFTSVTRGVQSNIKAAYGTIGTEISLVSNVGLAIGDRIIGPDIDAGLALQIAGWGPASPGMYSNIVVNTPVTVTSGDSLQFTRYGDNISKIKRNIDSANAVAVQAIQNDNGTLTIKVNEGSNLRVLDILPGDSGTALDGIGLRVYELTQTIGHPRYGVPEKFGTKVSIDDTGLTVAIASEGGNTLKVSTFDKEKTEFDKDTTRFIDSLNASGAVYLYDYLNPPGETLANPGKLLYNQVLQNAYVATGDNFGSSIDINRGWALVGAEFSNYHSTKAGAVHMFVNDTNVKGWSRLRSRGEEIDIDYINSVMLYDKVKQVNVQDLDYFDPAKGKILGIADQDLDYKSSYDPAFYNKGTRSSVSIATDSYWTSSQEAQTWWDLSLCRYVNYEQGSLNYRTTHWGELFPDSQIQVCEWVESSVLPSEYAATYGDGEAKYPDNSAYTEQTYYDNSSSLIKTRYYFWVINKQMFDRTKTARSNSIVTLEALIKNPQAQGVAFAAAIASNAFNIYNFKQYVKSSDTVFRVDYSRKLGDIISHNEFELIQQGNRNSTIPSKLISKLIDSLSGENSTGAVVPDLRLTDADAYGISNLPRQSMIRNNLDAAKVFVSFVNNVLGTQLVTNRRNFTRLLTKEPIPVAGVGFYDAAVDSVDQLLYIPDSELFVGFKVLVKSDSDFYNYWTIYEYSQYVGFRMIRIQSYDTTRWWNYANWYAPGYDQYINIDFIVPRYVDVYALGLQVGQTVKVLDNGKGTYTVYEYTTGGNLVEVVVENGTIQLSTGLYDPTQSRIGFDNSAFDQVGFSTTQSVELRSIFEALVYDIFINENLVELNNLFFTLLNYILSEQIVVDWAIKTSLVTILHKIRKLEQFTNYIKDNQDYYEQYINEVKPYRSQIREYLLDYEGLDELNVGMSDFDFPSIYDKATGTYRILNKNNPRDLVFINSSSRKDWLENYTYQIQGITLNYGGSGYTIAPRVNITGGGGRGATARAVLGPVTESGLASVVDVILTNPGAGYTSTPTVEFIGGNGLGASAAIVLVQELGTAVTSTTLNKKVRSIFTKLKFDRINYTSSIRAWQPYAIYHPGDLIVLDDVRLQNFANYSERQLPRLSTVYRVLKTLLGRPTIDLNVFEDPALVTRLSGSDLNNANDRLAAYLKPGSPDTARIYSSPDTIRLDSSSLNDQVISVAKKWNAVRHSVFWPVQHGYQYAAVGDASLIALSKDGATWETNRITDTTVNVRDVFLYRNYTWVAVANQGTIYTNDNGQDWVEEKISEYRFDPSGDAINGTLQENTAQILDLTGGASVRSTYADYLIAVGNNGTILANTRENSAFAVAHSGWYNIKVPSQAVIQNYLKVMSVDLGNLSNADGSTYDVIIQPVSGYFTESTAVAKRTMKAGFLMTIGVNGAINVITYNAIDDYMQGFLYGYNYNNGKGDNVNYPWKSLSVPIAIRGANDSYSGEQLTGIAVSGTDTNWIVAVGSAGTLVWNQYGLTIEYQDGRAELAPDTIDQQVVDYKFNSFENFRGFDENNFVAPLTKTQVTNYDFNDIVWDGEKFVVVADKSIILWGYPGVLADAYIEIGTQNPVQSVRTRRESASWTGGEGITSLTISVPTIDLDARSIDVGMNVTATGLPADTVVTEVTVGLTTHQIVVGFESTTVASTSERRVVFSYGLNSGLAVDDEIVVTNGSIEITLVVSKVAVRGDTKIYVNNWIDTIKNNWEVTGTGVPFGAKINRIGKFANFSWQLAPGVQENVNLDYRTVTVNSKTLTLSKPLLAANTQAGISGVYAGNLVTFFDPTGTIIQLNVTQDLPANSSVLTFESTRSIETGYSLQANTTLGIQDGTVVTGVVNYNIAGVVSGLQKDIPDLIPGTGYTGSQVQGTAFNNSNEDSLSIDTNITSEFTDNLLGQRPEDITIDGGKFIDTYSSHAPEELVPGQVIDSLQMNVFTANVVNGMPDYGNVIAYKILTDYKLSTTYYRLGGQNTTTLAANLAYADLEIFVTDIARLPDSGSVWINAEKIVYQSVDRTAGTLQDLRRGSLRTSVASVHAVGSLVTDATPSQLVAQDFTTAITQDVEVTNGIVGGSNSSIYLSSTVTSIPQSKIWLNLDV